MDVRLDRSRHEGFEMKFRLILPGAYLFLVLLMFAGSILSAGHGSSFSFVVFLMLPACKFLDFLPVAGDAGSSESLKALLLCTAAGLVQYILLGSIIDVLIKRFSRKSV